MTIKIHPPVTILYSSHQTTIQQLSQFVGAFMKELYLEAVSKSLVTGPVYWIYHGMDGKPDTLFTLEIALPVQGGFDPSKFQVKELSPFKTLAHIHEGAWEQLSGTYVQMMQYIESKKIPLQDECRELYLNIDFERPENNITEVQIGIV